VATGDGLAVVVAVVLDEAPGLSVLTVAPVWGEVPQAARSGTASAAVPIKSRERTEAPSK
jgi:hypothetical protein